MYLAQTNLIVDTSKVFTIVGSEKEGALVYLLAPSKDYAGYEHYIGKQAFDSLGRDAEVYNIKMAGVQLEPYTEPVIVRDPADISERQMLEIEALGNASKAGRLVAQALTNGCSLDPSQLDDYLLMVRGMSIKYMREAGIDTSELRRF